MTNSPVLPLLPLEAYVDDFESNIIIAPALDYVELRSDHADLNITEIVENNRYFKTMPETGSITLLSGEMGTGKTTLVRSLIAKHKSELDCGLVYKPIYRILVVSHRKLLNRQIAQALTVGYYEDIKALGDAGILTEVDQLATSPESLSYIDARNVYNMFFGDEFNQVLAHTARSATMGGYCRSAINKLRTLVCNAKTAILADTYTSLQLVEFLRSVQKHSTIKKPIVRIQNLYKPRVHQQAKIYLYTKHDEFIGAAEKFSTENPDMKLLGICNERKKTDALLTAFGGSPAEFYNDEVTTDRDLLINSKTFDASSSCDINSLVADKKRVVYSPTLGTGVSIDEGHGFNVAFCDFGGRSTTARECSQQMARFRGLSEYHLFIGGGHGTRPESISSVLDQYIHNPMSMEFIAIGEDYNADGDIVIDDYTRIAAGAIAEENQSKNNFKQSLLTVLRDEGFSIHQYSSYSNVDTELVDAGHIIMDRVREQQKADKEQEIAEKAVNIAAIYRLDDALALALAKKDEKYRIFTKAAKLASYAAMSAETAMQRDKQERLDVRRGTMSAIDLNYVSASKKLLDSIYGIVGIDMSTMTVDTDKSWSKADADTIKKLMTRKNWVRYEAMGIPISGKSLKNPNRWFNQAIKYLGLDVSIDRKHKSDVYRVDPASLDTLRMIMGC